MDPVLNCAVAFLNFMFFVFQTQAFVLVFLIHHQCLIMFTRVWLCLCDRQVAQIYSNWDMYLNKEQADWRIKTNEELNLLIKRKQYITRELNQEELPD